MREPAAGNQTQDGAGGRGRMALAAGLIVLAVVMAVGTFAAADGGTPPGKPQRPARLSEVLSQMIRTQGIEAGIAQYRGLREKGFSGATESESDTNGLGYQLLGKGDKDSAIQVFQLNVETHPRSSNAYDSLAEAYLAAGKKELAIENYRKAVAIDPGMTSAINALHELTGSPRKRYPPLVFVHIGAGLVGLLSGAVAMSLRKGFRGHRTAGNVFFVAMLCMSGMGAYLALMKSQTGNMIGGAMAFYMVSTAWAARRGDGETWRFDWGALLGILSLGVLMVVYGVEAMHSPTGLREGYPPALYFIWGLIALLCAAGDIRMLARGGVSGAQRIVRHLWRMSFALFIASGSFFLGQQKVMPSSWRGAPVLFVPAFLPLVLMLYWLGRVWFTKTYKRTVPAYSAGNDEMRLRKQSVPG